MVAPLRPRLDRARGQLHLPSPHARSAAAIAVVLLASGAGAEDVMPFKLTGYDGYTTLNYLADAQTSDQPDAGRTRTAQSGWRSELFVMTHSYVYHPNLLTLDIGGGPVLQTGSFLDDRGNTQAQRLLYNFSARANVLRGKPYTGTFYYSHMNPTVSVAPGEVMTQENINYGFDFSLLAPVTSVPMQLGFLRSQTLGHSSQRVVDERGDQLNFTGTRSFGAVGSTQLQYQGNQRTSKSGNSDLAVQSSTSDSHALNLDTRLQLGDARQYELTNLVSVNRQNYTLDTGSVPALSETRFMLDGRTRRPDGTQGSVSYSYAHSAQGVVDTTNQDASAGWSYRPFANTEGSWGVRAAESRMPQFKASSWGVDASVRSEQKLPLGALEAAYAVHFDDRQQSAATTHAEVLGERITLAGIDYTALVHRNIVDGTPVVSNAARSQVFVEGIDYRLTTVGDQTRIQRLIGGRILDGEPLLIDYSYQVGGTFAYKRLDQSVNLSWNLSRYGALYYRHYSSSQQLVSGQPTFALNNVTSNVFGARADLPLNLGIAMTLGGSVEHETRRETLLSYVRTSMDASIQTDESLLGLGFLRASARRARIDYNNPAQNSDLHMYDLRYWFRNSLGMDITAVMAMERDDAGLLPRQRRDQSLSVAWQKRKVSLSANVVHTDEVQGSIGRKRTSVQLQAKRDL